MQIVPAGDEAQRALVRQLHAILPAPDAGQRIALAVAAGGSMRTEFFASCESAAERALDLDRQGAQVYLSTAVFRAGEDGHWQKRDRTHLAPAGRKCLHLDIDVGDGKDYAAMPAAIVALRDFTMECGLRRGQAIVISGRGLHVYWALTSAIGAPEWDALAGQLADLCRAKGLRVDVKCTTDAVRLLRPVGTHNRKTPAEPLPVQVGAFELQPPAARVRDDWPTVDVDEFGGCVRKALEACGVPAGAATAAVGAVTSNDDLTALPARPETPDRVAWVRARLDAIDPDCSRDEWRDATWAVASTGWHCARELALAWSQRGTKFDAAEFDKLWGSYRADAGGPTLGTLDHLAKKHGFAPPVVASSDPLPIGTDAWHAREFARTMCGRLLFVHGSGRWARWDGTHWTWCGEGHDVRAAVAYAEGLLRKAQDAERTLGVNHPQAIAMHKDAARLSSAKAITNMLTLARAMPEVSLADAGQFDADPWLLGVTNGVVNLKEGTLLAPDPRMLVMRQCGAAFDRGAECPQWLRFLNEVFQGDAETVDYVQRLAGYCLTGDVGAELLHFMYGFGANGKSVFANVFGHVMGGYVYHATIGLLVHDARDTGKGPNPDMVRMAGARVVYVNETEQGARLSEVTMKALVSTEPVTTRELYGSPFTFVPTAKLLVRGNHKPVVTGTDNGIWRRLRLLPFLRQFNDDERDDGLTARLVAEADGILQWALEGLRKWQRHGLKPSGAVDRASAAYRRDMDVVGQWLDDECSTANPQAFVTVSAAYTAYSQHCQRSGMRAHSQNALTRELERRGIEKSQRTIDGKRTRVYLGIGLLAG
ncbi:MAG: PriCT-2 domain-containing protein [Proteobacteria bacterium]|nr:PriCT-2 domain-containing protein [Pseudomonadota bacterium]